MKRYGRERKAHNELTCAQAALGRIPNDIHSIPDDTRLEDMRISIIRMLKRHPMEQES